MEILPNSFWLRTSVERWTPSLCKLPLGKFFMTRTELATTPYS